MVSATRSIIMRLPEEDRDDLRIVIDCALAYLTEYGTRTQALAIDRIARKYAPDIAEEWRGQERPSDPPRFLTEPDR